MPDDSTVSGKAALLDIEVAYATSARQVIVALKLPAGTTVQAAISASGLLAEFPEINEAELKVGIFAEVCKPEHILRQGDRVEIYRPLCIDPKKARHQRAAR